MRASALIERNTAEKVNGHAFEASRGAYLRAQIACAVGDLSQAVTLLTRALAEGRYHSWNVHTDPLAELFLPLRDYPQFIQLMTPKP